MPPFLIHLICGSTGAGKTTYALRLADDLGAARFSIDEWMTRLFWMDTPQPLEPAWSIERVERCMAQIWATASDVAARGTPCILDFGFGQAMTRKRFADLARQSGLTVQLHVLDLPAEERWRRVERRNAEKGDSYQLTFDVTREMFDFVEGMWEPPPADETAVYDSVVVSKD